MKKLLLKTIFLMLAIASISFPQWSNDPNNNLVIAIGWDPHIASDSAGGCYITYNYDSFYPQKLAVERLDKYGYKPWIDRKQILGELPEQWQAEIIEDEEGGVIISYEDNQVVGTDFTSRVRVQKVDSNGNFLWGQTGVRVTLSETNQGSNQPVSDGEGGCVVLFQYYDGIFAINRIDRFGQRVWGDTAIVLGIGGSNNRIIRASDGNYYVETGTTIYRISRDGEILDQYSVTLGYIVPDPEGGIVLSGRVWTGMIPKLVSQRKDSLGNNLWQEPYVEIADSLHINTLIDIQHNSDYYYFSWVGTKNEYTNRAQFQSLRKDGSLLFSSGSELLSSDSAISKIGIIPSYFSRIIFCWNIPGIINSAYCQLYDTLGNKHWNENGVIVARPNILYQSFTTDGNGGFIIAGVVNSFTVVAQQVNIYGQLGQIITGLETKKEILTKETILFQNYPNPYNSSTTIQFQLPKESKININLYNVLGEKIQTIANGLYPRGMNSIQFSSDDLPSGIYLYKLQTETNSLTKKLIIIK